MGFLPHPCAACTPIRLASGPSPGWDRKSLVWAFRCQPALPFFESLTSTYIWQISQCLLFLSTPGVSCSLCERRCGSWPTTRKNIGIREYRPLKNDQGCLDLSDSLFLSTPGVSCSPCEHGCRSCATSMKRLSSREFCPLNNKRGGGTGGEDTGVHSC